MPETLPEASMPETLPTLVGTLDQLRPEWRCVCYWKWLLAREFTFFIGVGLHFHSLKYDHHVQCNGADRY